MICNHWRYNLWDKKLPYWWVSFEDDLCNYLWVTISELEKDYIYIPLSLYDHSWISMSTWVSHWWDSWQVWYIYVSRKDAREWLQVKKLNTKKVLEKLESEVEEYDKYLTGQVFMFNTSVWDCVYSWYYEEESAIEEAKAEIDYHIKSEIEKHNNYIKKCIKSWVNILYRKELQLC